MTIAPPTRISATRPLRVHVLGSSCSVLVEPAHGPRDGGTYAEQLAGLLTEAGTPTVASNAGTWFGRICDSLEHYERDVRNHLPRRPGHQLRHGRVPVRRAPDLAGPHITTWHRTSRAGTTVYREKVVPPVWRQLRKYQQKAGRRDTRTHRLRPSRFVADMTRTIDMARKDCGPLVLLLDIDPPGPRVEHWLPGTGRRVEEYNGLLADIAGRYDDAVRLVRAGTQLTDPATQLPDGLHRSPEGHAMTARLLADEITAWLGA